jgi:hypothetical protein
MWEFGDAVWDEVFRQTTGEPITPLALDPSPHLKELLAGISLIVCEDWRLYPWVMRAGGLDYDECRTARLIGSLYQACRVAGWEWHVTQTKNKRDAKFAGAELLFVHPLHENRHTNDSRMAGWLHVLAHNGPEASQEDAGGV